MTSPNKTPYAVVIDANVLIALCAKEALKLPKAEAQVEHYTKAGYVFYAPGVIIAETLFALCRQLADGLITQPNHARAIATLDGYLQYILSPPMGDASLMKRAEKIQSGYGCSRSADGIYIALAEELSLTRTTVLLTFDLDLPKQAAKNAPSVNVHLLTI